MRSTAFRLIVSALAGVVTFYAVALTLRFGAEWLFYRYCDVFGLGPLIARLIDPSFTGEEGDVFQTGAGERIAFLVEIGFWSLLFGILYFCFVFRAHRTI